MTALKYAAECGFCGIGMDREDEPWAIKAGRFWYAPDQCDVDDDGTRCPIEDKHAPLVLAADVSEYEALCPCVEDIDGKQIADPGHTGCRGTGVIPAEEHPSWCDRCGLRGNCPDCDPKMSWEN